MDTLTHKQNSGNGNTEPQMVPDRPQSKSYYWPASVHDRLARLADRRHTSASAVSLEIVERGLTEAEAQP